MDNSLYNYDKGLNNNLNILKILAALLVLFTHSYSLTGSLTNFVVDKFGSIAVSFFFFVSGYYSIKKLNKNESYSNFIIGRIKALWPLLIEIVILIVFVIGPLTTQLSSKSYFLNKNTYMYLLVLFMIRIHYLPGVFINNPYGSEVNGSLWTLPFQCICYLIAICFHKIVNNTNKIFIIFLNMLLLVIELLIPHLFSGYYYNVISSGYRAIVIFIIGMQYYIYNKRIKLNIKWLIIMFVLSMLLYFVGIENSFYYLFLPYAVCLIVYKHQIIDKKLIGGGLSYPIYLLGFPIQQTLIYYSNNSMSPIMNWIISSIICILISLILVAFNRKIKERFAK